MAKAMALPREAAALLAAILAAAAYLSFSPDIFNDADTSWHLAAGKLILGSGSVPVADPFSFTFAGRPWTAHEWLAELILAAAFVLGSWGGVALVTAGAVAGLLLIVGRHLARWYPARRSLAALAALSVVLAPFILARPHVFGWPLLAGWTLGLLSARERERPPPLPLLLIMLVWANLHGSFVIGLALIGVFALEAFIASRFDFRSIRGWALFGLLALGASVVTPYGAQGLLFPLQVSSMKALPIIAEWRRTSFPEDGLFLALAAAAALLLVIRRPRVSLVRLGLLAGLLLMALAHARHQPIFAIVAALVLAEPLAQAKARDRVPLPALLVPVAVGFLLLGAVRLALPSERRDGPTYPATAIAHLPPELRARPILNSYSFGGPLILHGIKPYIDGRADLYGDDFVLEHHRIVQGDWAAFERARSRWKIGLTMLAPDSELIPLLDRNPAWRRVYADRWAVIHAAR